MCANCHKTRPFGDLQFLTRPAVQKKMREIVARIASEAPTRLCDDPEKWDFRAYLSGTLTPAR